MRSQKFLYVSATMLASLTMASMSFADESSQTKEQTTTQGQQGHHGTHAPVQGATPTAPIGQPIAPPVTGTTTTTAGDPGTLTELAAQPQPDTITIYDRRRPNTPLLITGGALFVGSYATTAGVTAAGGREADENLYIPVVGPWLNLADRQCENCPNETVNQILIAGSGVLQGLGVLMVGASFLIPEKVETARIQAGPVTVRFAPTAARGGGGIGAFGTF